MNDKIKIAKLYIFRDIFCKIIYLIMVFAVGHYSLEIFKCLSGKTTIANVFINFLANFKNSISFVMVFLSFLGWGRENRIRKNQNKISSEQIIKLQRMVDANKGTSSLMSNGNTNKQDI